MGDDELLMLALAQYEMDEPHWDEDEPYLPAISAETLAQYLASNHDGDCTGQPHTCVRCLAEHWQHKAAWLADALARDATMTTFLERQRLAQELWLIHNDQRIWPAPWEDATERQRDQYLGYADRILAIPEIAAALARNTGRMTPEGTPPWAWPDKDGNIPADAGSPAARLDWFFEELEKRLDLPEEHEYSSRPPELYYLEAIDKLIALAGTRPEGESEPVAWLIQIFEDGWHTVRSQLELPRPLPGVRSVPLFLAPADANSKRARELEAALARILRHPNAQFNVAAVKHGEPTIAEIARHAMAGIPLP